MFELRRFTARVGVAVVVVVLAVVLAVGTAVGAVRSAIPARPAWTASDAARDATLTRVGIFAGIEESEQASTARR